MLARNLVITHKYSKRTQSLPKLMSIESVMPSSHLILCHPLLLYVKVLHSICQQVWKTQQWTQDWKRSAFIPIPKKGNAKECSNYCTITLISHASKVMLKILQARPQQYMKRAHVDLTSLAPHERLPEILVVPREKTPTGAAARGNP